MAWVGAAIGGLSAVSGIMGSRSAKKQQQQALDLQREQLQFSKDRYNRAVGIYGDLEQKVADQAMEGVKADLGGVSDRAAGDIALQFQGANEAVLRDQQRMGVNPNSGQASSQMRQSRLSQALATAGGITAARENERRIAEQQTWDRRFGTSQVGVNQMNGTASNVSGASSGLSGMMMSMADQQLAESNAAIAGGANMFGSALANRFGGTAAKNATKMGDVKPTLGTQPAAKVTGLAPLQSQQLDYAPAPFNPSEY